MASKYVKTDAGQREIRERAHSLPRGARTLLVLADGSKDGEQLLALVQGATPDDLATLVQLGLVSEAAGTPRSAAPGRAAAAAAAAAAAPVQDGGAATLGSQELYESLTQLVKSQLGLMKAFKYTLDIEKAGSVPELLEIARRFAADVESAKGETAAAMVRRALGLAA